jgi:hypothetical protein
LPFSERVKAPLSVNAISYVMTTIDDDAKVAAKIRREQTRNNRPHHYQIEINPKDFTWEKRLLVK